MNERDPVDAVLAGSDGEYYTDWELERRLRTGAWKPCIRQFDPDRRLVETDGGRLLLLVPVDPDELPRWTELRVEGDSTRVVERRRPVPS